MSNQTARIIENAKFREHLAALRERVVECAVNAHLYANTQHELDTAVDAYLAAKEQSNG